MRSKNPMAISWEASHHRLKDELRRLVPKLGVSEEGRRLPKQRPEVARQYINVRTDDGTKRKIGSVRDLSTALRHGCACDQLGVRDIREVVKLLNGSKTHL